MAWKGESRLIRMRRIEAAQDGRTLEVKRKWVPLEAVSIHVIDAVVEHVDPRFFSHRGFDMTRIARAWKTNRKLRRRAMGGSSITAQLAKNLYFSLEKTYTRKVLEVPVTLWMELAWGKHRILETYLNVAEWGDGVFGIEAAATEYFGIPALEVDLRQACALSAVLPNPRLWSPLRPTYYTLALAETLRRRVLARRE
ncbi:MAG: monofunctional biosynthetic peptidoglycan transglycosylase [Terrimicrobiaceae bacterium]|nr:monofunctional biosynthetic peptidoglycan transglycosylase [Terrimicrobiaceae bacterium]